MAEAVVVEVRFLSELVPMVALVVAEVEETVWQVEQVIHLLQIQLKEKMVELLRVAQVLVMIVAAVVVEQLL